MLWRLRMWLFHAATGAPRVAGLRVSDPGLMTGSFADDLKLRQAWWAFPVRLHGFHLIAFWWSPRWWGQQAHAVLFWAFWFPLVKSGLWRVSRYGLFTEGRLQWPDMWARARMTEPT